MMPKWLAATFILAGLAASPGKADVIHTFFDAPGHSTADLDFRVVSPFSLIKVVEPVSNASGIYGSDFPDGSALSCEDAFFWHFIFLPDVDAWLSSRFCQRSCRAVAGLLT
jgi:hypothetical protein